MSRSQLLGTLDADTRQWNDGVLTSIAITVNEEATGSYYRKIMKFQINRFC